MGQNGQKKVIEVRNPHFGPLGTPPRTPEGTFLHPHPAPASPVDPLLPASPGERWAPTPAARWAEFRRPLPGRLPSLAGREITGLRRNVSATPARTPAAHREDGRPGLRHCPPEPGPAAKHPQSPATAVQPFTE
jgi:hypothetical protein